MELARDTERIWGVLSIQLSWENIYLVYPELSHVTFPHNTFKSRGRVARNWIVRLPWGLVFAERMSQKVKRVEKWEDIEKRKLKHWAIRYGMDKEGNTIKIHLLDREQMQGQDSKASIDRCFGEHQEWRAVDIVVSRCSRLCGYVCYTGALKSVVWKLILPLCGSLPEFLSPQTFLSFLQPLNLHIILFADK